MWLPILLLAKSAIRERKAGLYAILAFSILISFGYTLGKNRANVDSKIQIERESQQAGVTDL